MDPANPLIGCIVMVLLLRRTQEPWLTTPSMHGYKSEDTLVVSPNGCLWLMPNQDTRFYRNRFTLIRNRPSLSTRHSPGVRGKERVQMLG